ncbi:hypothetical protein GOBAR_DD02368 [Gossypium barbadense]|nr:hypothetical protein GOBAR_DD02368 [Gossypium barbadense]
MSSADGEDNMGEAKSGSGDKFSSNVSVKKSDGCDSRHNPTMAENIGKPTVNGACSVKSSSLEFVVTFNISILPHLGDENCQAEDEPLSDHFQVDRTIPISTELSSDDSIVDRWI